MMTEITRKQLAVGALIWWGVFFALVGTGFNFFNLQNSIGFVTLIFLPGFLTLIALRLGHLEWWGEISLIIGLSILELMLLGLLGNAVLPLVGVVRPLDKWPLLIECTVLILTLIGICYYRVKSISFEQKRYVFFETKQSTIVALLPFLFVFLSAIGAVSLNNRGSNVFTMAMLLGIAIYSAYVMWKHKELEENVMPLALFCISLSMLLMTSLRGWYITGHDIQREYRVFQIAKEFGYWAIANYHDAYNACISITILPTIFSNLLRVFDPYVYKILFQVLFALVPGVLYLTVRRYTKPVIAFMSVLYFISFPTFFGDMPFLNRQEIAFVFLVLMVYIIFADAISLRKRQLLFLFLGIGLILSHYSTTYTVVALLLFMIPARPIANWIAAYIAKRGWLQQSGFAILHAGHQGTKRITFAMIMLLAAASFFWSSVLTDTSSNSLYRVISETVSVINNNSKEDARSGDVLYHLFSWKTVDTEEQLAQYRKHVEALRKAEPNSYYDTFSYEKYPMTIAPPGLLAMTKLGYFFDRMGINVYDFNYYSRQISAKLIQVFVVIGFIAFFFRKKLLEQPLPTEFVLLAAGSMAMVLSQVVLPVLSVEYGLLRAFQQSLIFLGLFVVAGSIVFGTLFGSKRSMFVAGALAITFMLSTTGVISQTLGGYAPQLHLNNGGTYYDIYYLHRSDLAGVNWLVAELEGQERASFQAQAQTDRFSSNRISLPKNVGIYSDIFPGLIRKDSYVYMSSESVIKEQVTMSYNGDLITYSYPVSFLDDNKDLLYNNGFSRVYR